MMSYFCKIGGLTPLLKTLLKNDLTHGDYMTVTRQTVAQSFKKTHSYPRE